MRKGSVFAAVFCFVLSTMGCSNAFNDGRGNAGGGQDVTTPNPDLARVEIQLPPRTVAPFGVGLPDAREHTDFFQVVFRRTDGDSGFIYISHGNGNI